MRKTNRTEFARKLYDDSVAINIHTYIPIRNGRTIYYIFAYIRKCEVIKLQWILKRHIRQNHLASVLSSWLGEILQRYNLLKARIIEFNVIWQIPHWATFTWRFSSRISIYLSTCHSLAIVEKKRISERASERNADSVRERRA